MTTAARNRSAKAATEAAGKKTPMDLSAWTIISLLGWAPPLRVKGELLPGGSIGLSID